MYPTHILLKFISQEKFLNDFLSGSLYMNSLYYFWNEFVLESVKKGKRIPLEELAKNEVYGQTDLFEKINVNGTKNVVDFCTKQKMRLLHISTISVSGNGEKEETIVETPENMQYKKLFKETSLYIHQNIKGIYAVSLELPRYGSGVK